MYILLKLPNGHMTLNNVASTSLMTSSRLIDVDMILFPRNATDGYAVNIRQNCLHMCALNINHIVFIKEKKNIKKISLSQSNCVRLTIKYVIFFIGVVNDII